MWYPQARKISWEFMPGEISRDNEDLELLNDSVKTTDWVFHTGRPFTVDYETIVWATETPCKMASALCQIKKLKIVYISAIRSG